MNKMIEFDFFFCRQVSGDQCISLTALVTEQRPEHSSLLSVQYHTHHPNQQLFDVYEVRFQSAVHGCTNKD